MQQRTFSFLLAATLVAVPAWAATPRPTISAVSPTSGDCTTLLTITGTHFSKEAKVHWGGPSYASPATVRGSTQLSVYLPPVEGPTVVHVYVATYAGASQSGGLVTIKPAAAAGCGNNPPRAVEEKSVEMGTAVRP